MIDQTRESTVVEIIDEVRSLFEARGSAWYGGEAVSQLEHALQAAMFAERESASPELIVAALLHDVGYLLHDLPENAAERGVDDRHEMLGTAWLGQNFGPAVAEPVGRHVVAKRYLVAVEAEYTSQLSRASQQSLQLQGGPMTGDEVREFESRPFCVDAVRLRRWDGAAKVVDLETPPLNHFTGHIESALRNAQP